MNSSFPSIQTVLPTALDRQRPFEWIGELAEFLRRNRYVVFICTLIMVVLATIYTMTAKPWFSASTTLFIDERQSELFQQHPAVTDAQIENARIESEVEILRSAGLARKVLVKLDLAHDPNFSQASTFSTWISPWRSSPPPVTSGGQSAADTAEDRRVMQFLSMVVPHRVGLTYVIEIDATATNSVLAARLANGLADSYIAEQLEVRETSARQAAGWLQAKLVQLQDQALKSDQAAQLFKIKNGIVETDHGLLNEQQIGELNTDLVAAHTRVALATARLDRIRQMTGSHGAGGLVTSDMIQSPVINGLQEHYLRDAQHVAEWSAEYGHDHAAAVLLRREMGQLQASIGSEARRIEAAAGSDVAVARSNEVALQAQLDAAVGQSATTDRARATYRSLQSAAETYRSLYVTFLQRAMQTSQDQSFPVADVRVITHATPPLTKSKPQGKLILMGATIFGLGLGFFLGLLRDALDRQIRSADDLMSQTGLSCLAFLPVIGQAQTSPSRWWTARSATSSSGFDRGIRQLQLRLQQQGDAGGGRVIGLIAPMEGMGTSTVAIRLAESLSKSGYDAVLLDLSTVTGSREQILGRFELLHRSRNIIIADFPPLSNPCDAHSIFTDIEDIVLVIDTNQIKGIEILRSLREAGLKSRTLLGVVMNNVRKNVLL